MKKIVLMSLMMLAALHTQNAAAVSVGDILYHDGTFSSSFTSDKMAIGVVYWVSPQNGFGHVMALNQPNDMTYENAVAYCESYQTVGAAKGRWHLPNPTELIHMGKEQWNGTSNNKFAELNAKLATITDLGEQLKAGSYYFAHSSAQYKFKLDAYAAPTTGGNGAVRCVLNF